MIIEKQKHIRSIFNTALYKAIRIRVYKEEPYEGCIFKNQW